MITQTQLARIDRELFEYSDRLDYLLTYEPYRIGEIRWLREHIKDLQKMKRRLPKMRYRLNVPLFQGKQPTIFYSRPSSEKDIDDSVKFLLQDPNIRREDFKYIGVYKDYLEPPITQYPVTGISWRLRKRMPSWKQTSAFVGFISLSNCQAYLDEEQILYWTKKVEV